MMALREQEWASVRLLHFQPQNILNMLSQGRGWCILEFGGCLLESKGTPAKWHLFTWQTIKRYVESSELSKNYPVYARVV